MSNIPGANLRQQPPNNTWTLGLPVSINAPIPLLDTIDDTGKFVKGILLNREKLLGKRVYGATDYYSSERLIKEFAEVFPEAGKDAKAVEIPAEVFKGILTKAGRPADELLQNFQMLDDCGYYGGDSLAESHSVSYLGGGFMLMVRC